MSFRKKCKPTKLCKMSSPEVFQAYCVMKIVWVCMPTGFWMAPPMWYESNFFRTLAEEAETGGERLADPGGQPARLLPAAERATGHHKHRYVFSGHCSPPSINPQARDGLGPITKGGLSAGQCIGCVYRNPRLLCQSPGQEVSSLHLYLYNS